MRSSRLAGLALAAVVAVSSGCGGGDDEKAGTSSTTSTQAPATTTTPGTGTSATPPASENVKRDPAAARVVQAFYNAMAQRNGNAACTQLNPELSQTAIDLVKKVPGNGAVTTCADALTASVRMNTATQLRALRNVKIITATSDGARATVKVQNAPEDVLLTRSGGRWLISSGIFRT